MLQGLFGNLAVVALVISAWVHAQHWLKTQKRITQRIVFGAITGLGTVMSMLMSIRLDGGIIIDLRTSLAAVAGFFGGPIPALICGAIAAGFRLTLGGEGTMAGVIGIVLATATGVLFYALTDKGHPNWFQALLASVATAVVPMLAALTVPPALTADVMSHFGLTLILLKVVVTFGASCLLMHGASVTEEQSLLRAALAQSPDYLYVKNVRSEFVTVNRTVAAYHGFEEPSEMEGKTDFDLTKEDRALALFEGEQDIIRSGQPIVDLEEELEDSAGRKHWFSTSKAAIRNPDGEIMGLAGVTRDISERKRLETDLLNSKSQLSYVLTEMSDGLALFDQAGTLVFCNEQYRASFPLTAAERYPGASIRDILRAVAVAGEQVGLPDGNVDGWIEGIAGSLHQESEQEINLADGRWMQIRTRPTKDRWSVVVVSDVTTIKQAEVALQGLTDQLRQLAATDSLTGLLNRRALDEALDRELNRSVREQQPISLLLVDVDRFKAFNDLYGHPAGDRCLRALSECIGTVLRRPGDVGARYGGEEFVAILPNTDEDGAFAVAESLRVALRQLQLPHQGSEKGVVTVSIGIASYEAKHSKRRATELIIRADEALYTAKEAGRDRAMGWRARHPVRELKASVG